MICRPRSDSSAPVSLRVICRRADSSSYGVAVHIIIMLGAVGLVLGGCQQNRQEKAAGPGQPLLISRIELFDRTLPDNKVPGLSREMLLAWVKEKLASSRALKVVRDKTKVKKAYHLQVELGIGQQKEYSGERRRVVIIGSRARVPEVLESMDLQASSVVAFPKLKDSNEERIFIKKTLGAVLNDLIYQAELVIAPEEKLVKALEQKHDLDRLAAAEEITAMRKVNRAVPVLIKLLKHPEAKISDRAVGALVAIGDQRAVRHLTRLSKFQDTARLAKIIDAIGALGGREAKEYLEFVASGHEDADIRNLAAEALERMERKEGQGKKPSPAQGS